MRRAAGKSDTIDAEAAARVGAGGPSDERPPRPRTGRRDDAAAQDRAGYRRKARTTAMATLKQIVVTASPALREPLQALTDHALLTRCAGYRPGPLDTPTAAAKHTLRALARRWLALAEEIADARPAPRPDSQLRRRPPSARASGSAPAPPPMLILFGDNPDRIREAAFAKLCGACPLQAASSGRDHRPAPPHRGGPPTRLPSIEPSSSVCGSTSRRSTTSSRRTAAWPDQTRDHPVPQTLPRP